MREPLVLLPDTMCDARLFQAFISEFSSQRAIIVPNFSSEITIEAMSQAVLATLPSEFALIGTGLGGLVAMDMIRRDAKRVTKLALISCAPLAETPQVSADRESKIISAKIGRLEEVLRDELQTGMLATTDMKVQHQNILVEMGLDLGAEAYVTQSRAMQRRLDQQATLRRMRIPTAVICGAQDLIVPARRQEFMAELIPSASFHMFENAGHFPTLETPELSIGAVKSLLLAGSEAIV